ncbi:rhodanese-like domain-containing protein [Bacillus salitolerans]|uniref:Rhodanese-like domain-containing protein n=1 Tax=Bacillus salitolerans TaxID=1437434 RepID=A0ABW4LXV2_9BACI
MFLLIIYLGFTFLEKKSIETISISELEKRLQEQKSESVVFIHVREQHEYKSGHVKGMKNYPLSTFKTDYKTLPRDAKVIILCRSGKRSLQAAEILKGNGFTNIKSVDGVIIQWTG